MHQEMSDLKSDEKADPSDRRLSDVYELVMTPCETSVDVDMTDDKPSSPKVAHRRKDGRLRQLLFRTNESALSNDTESTHT